MKALKLVGLTGLFNISSLIFQTFNKIFPPPHQPIVKYLPLGVNLAFIITYFFADIGVIFLTQEEEGAKRYLI